MPDKYQSVCSTSKSSIETYLVENYIVTNFPRGYELRHGKRFGDKTETQARLEKAQNFILMANKEIAHIRKQLARPRNNYVIEEILVS